ncbi:MAG: hypothetical protein JW955_14790 [Sedimentisphaerales bacterium]|nr:hypothetical protein [Sedimentisphaerales bacterium]
MKRAWVALSLCGCMALPAVAAPTGTVTMKYLTWEAGAYKTVSLYASSDGVYPPYEVAYSSGVVAGYYVHDVTAATGDGAYLTDPLLGFCIDLSQGPSYLPVTYDVVPLAEAPNPTFISSSMTAAKADLLQELWGRHFSATMTNEQAAQFQLAVWEIVFETSGTYDISSGSVRSNDLNLGTNTLLNSLDGTGPKASLVALTHPQYQDMLTEIQIPIPAPGALVLSSIGLFMIRSLRIRRGPWQG